MSELENQKPKKKIKLLFWKDNNKTDEVIKSKSKDSKKQQADDNTYPFF